MGKKTWMILLLNMKGQRPAGTKIDTFKAIAEWWRGLVLIKVMGWNQETENFKNNTPNRMGIATFWGIK